MIGRIVKGIAGFYYVETERGLIETKGRGLFRKDGLTPSVGDIVDISVFQEGTGRIERIHPRKNEFSRPAVVNIDAFIIVFSASHPAPNYEIIDKFLISAAQKNTDVLILVNKSDTVSKETLAEIKTRFAGSYQILAVSALTGEGMDELPRFMNGKCTALAGPSGVGKSTLTNRLIPDAAMETGEVSAKTRRGRHTTRHVELFRLPGGGYLFDTPGFVSFDIQDIKPRDLGAYYPDFEPYSGSCRFDDCRHLTEPGCAVREAAANGKIHEDRYRTYTAIYRELEEQNRRK